MEFLQECAILRRVDVVLVEVLVCHVVGELEMSKASRIARSGRALARAGIKSNESEAAIRS